MSCEPEKPRTATNCDPCGPAVRNRYFRGKLLTVADYQAEQRYMIQRRRLINRTLLGYGIVSGLEVGPESEQALSVGSGVAIDGAGRELVACERVVLREADDLLWLQKRDAGKGGCGLEAVKPFQATEYVLSAHYAERDVNGVKVLDGCKEQHCEENHICETVVYSVRRRDECPFPFERHCQHAKAKPGRRIDWPTKSPRLAPAGDKGADDLCRGMWDERCRRDFDPCGAHKLDPTHGLRVALDDGLPLAIVQIEIGRCDIRFTKIIEIVRDCALTRIAAVGWEDWIDAPSGTIYFSDLQAKFSPKPPPETADAAATPAEPEQKSRPRGKRPEGEPVDTGLWVQLSGPVQVDSLRPDVMAITLLQRDGNEQVETLYRVPIRALWVDDPCDGDPLDTTRRFRPMLGRRFWTGEINPDQASGFENRTIVEIEIRTDFIVDWFGREVAGWGRHAPSRGTATCGRFLTSIIVLPDPAEAEADATPAQEEMQQ